MKNLMLSVAMIMVLPVAQGQKKYGLAKLQKHIPALRHTTFHGPEMWGIIENGKACKWDSSAAVLETDTRKNTLVFASAEIVIYFEVGKHTHVKKNKERVNSKIRDTYYEAVDNENVPCYIVLSKLKRSRYVALVYNNLKFIFVLKEKEHFRVK